MICNASFFQLLTDYDEYLEGTYIRYKELQNEIEVVKQRHTSSIEVQSETEKPIKTSTSSYNTNEEYAVASARNGGSSSYVLQGLKPNAKYDIFLVPYYKMLQGKPSNAKVGKTLEDGKLYIYDFIIFQIFSKHILKLYMKST